MSRRPAPPAQTHVPVELPVQITWLLHSRPHHHDDEETRHEKVAASEEARQHERRFFFLIDTPVSEWTAEDIVQTIDGIRATMPTESPDGHGMGGLAFHQPENDIYQDGRRLMRVRMDTIGPPHDQTMTLWFSTTAGYAARVVLPSAPPGAALASLATSADGYFEVQLELNLRAIRAYAERAPRADLPRQHRATIAAAYAKACRETRKALPEDVTPADRVARVIAERSGPRVRRTLKKTRIQYVDNPALFIARAAQLVPTWQPLKASMCLSTGRLDTSLSISFGQDVNGVTTTVQVDLEPSDVPTLAGYLLCRPHATLIGLVEAELDADIDDDGGEGLPVPTFNEGSLAEMRTRVGVQ